MPQNNQQREGLKMSPLFSFVALLIYNQKPTAMKSKTLELISEIFSIIAIAISTFGIIAFAAAAVIIMTMERGSVMSDTFAITGVALIGIALICSVAYAATRKMAEKKFYLERGL